MGEEPQTKNQAQPFHRDLLAAESLQPFPASYPNATTAPAGFRAFLYTPVNRTRTSQKIIITATRRIGAFRIGEPRSASGKCCCFPRKKDAAAINNAKPIRQ